MITFVDMINIERESDIETLRKVALMLVNIYVVGS